MLERFEVNCSIDKFWFMFKTNNNFYFAENSPDSCPAGFQEFSPLCLKTTSRKKAVEAARRVCDRDVSFLPIIRAREVDVILSNALNKTERLRSFWLGLTYSEVSDQKAVWATGENFKSDEYDNFNKNRRLNGEKPCTVFNHVNHNWRNNQCNVTRHFVCMKWFEKVRPISAQFSDENPLPAAAGMYIPLNGVVLNGAPVYETTSETSQKFFLYRGSNQTGKWNSYDTF